MHACVEMSMVEHCVLGTSSTEEDFEVSSNTARGLRELAPVYATIAPDTHYLENPRNALTALQTRRCNPVRGEVFLVPRKVW